VTPQDGQVSVHVPHWPHSADQLVTPSSPNCQCDPSGTAGTFHSQYPDGNILNSHYLYKNSGCVKREDRQVRTKTLVLKFTMSKTALSRGLFFSYITVIMLINNNQVSTENSLVKSSVAMIK